MFLKWLARVAGAGLFLATVGLTPAPAQASSVPSLDHVFVIVMENALYGEVIGNSGAPYLNSLAATNGLATHYSGVGHPSLPNYLSLTGASTFGITSDCTTCWIASSNIADLVEAGGRTWKAYEESMPSACFIGDSYPYMQKHDPFIYYNDIRTNTSRCQSHVVPFTRLATDLQSAATTPNYAFITPNMCDDMHDCTIASGDSWLQRQVPAILNSPAFTQQRSVLAVTWDESDSTTSNQVATILAGSGIAAGTTSSNSYDHYSLLHTFESALGLGSLNGTDSSAPLMGDFFTAITPPPPSPSPSPLPSPSPSPSPVPTPSPSPSPAPAPWLTGPISAGGILTSAPGAFSSSTSSADVFVRGNDRGLYEIQSNGTSLGSWTALGGILTSDPGAAAGSVFVRGTDNALYQKTWNGSAWGPWRSLGGILTSGPGASTRPGITPQLDVWVAGNDRQLYHRVSADSGITFAPWEALGGLITAEPAAVSWSSTRIDVFVRGIDYRLYHRFWNAGIGWSSWEDLGGILTSAPAAASCSANHLDVFVRGTDNALYRRAWNGTTWSGWSRVGGDWMSSPAAVCIAGTGNLGVFVRGTDNTLWMLPEAASQ